MKKILFVVVIVCVLAVSISYFAYLNFAKQSAVESFMENIAKNQSQLRKCEASGNIVSGDVAFQNGFGAWSVDYFKGVLSSDGLFSYKVAAMYIKPKDGDIHIYETRDEIILINKEIEKIEKEMDEILAEEEKVSERLKKWGASVEEQAILRKNAEKRMERMLKLTEKARQLSEKRFE